MRTFGILIVGACLSQLPGAAETIVNGRRSVVLDGQAAQLTVDLAGGSIVDFHLQKGGLNPLRWEEKGGQTSPRPMGHFLCLDRWGAPSDSEKANGMPFHGEASRVEWKVLNDAATHGDVVNATMSAALPMAGISITRQIRLAAGSSFFVVTEEVKNNNKLGRVYNMVQHATIGPPFLDETTVVDSNARKGFMQSSPLPNPEEPVVYWPQALKDGAPVNLRFLTNDPMPNVVSYTIDEDYGWVTAVNAEKGLLIGYLWKTSDYPWFNAWRHVESGKPLARGLEFGTTGLHQPYPILIAKGSIFGRPIYKYLDAGETASRSYASFLMEVPKGFRGVSRVEYSGGQVTVHERDGGPRVVRLTVGELFPK
jgi:hypothetical protein